MVALYRDQGETSRVVFTEFDDDEGLVICGVDTGKAALECWGNEDYEFWVTVKKEQIEKVIKALIKRNLKLKKPMMIKSSNKNRTLIALIKRFYKGHFSAVYDFMKFLKLHRIPYEFGFWN